MTTGSNDRPSKGTNASFLMVILSFVALWLVLDRSANYLGSFRGEWGLVVFVVVLAAAIPIEHALGGERYSRISASLGLKLPSSSSIVRAVSVSAFMLCFFPVYAAMFGLGLELRDDWYFLLPGLLAQGGLAEELVFRGFLFRHLRARGSFLSASIISMLIFAVIHLPLFWILEPAIALDLSALGRGLRPRRHVDDRANRSKRPLARR